MSTKSHHVQIAEFIHKKATNATYRITLQEEAVEAFGCPFGTVDNFVGYLECCGVIEKTKTSLRNYVKTTPVLQYLIETEKIDILYKACWDSLQIKFWPNYATDLIFKEKGVILTSDKKRLLGRFITYSPRFEKFYNDVGPQITKLMKDQLKANWSLFIQTTDWKAQKTKPRENKEKVQKNFLTDNKDVIIDIGTVIKSMSDMSETVRGITESTLTQNAAGDISGSINGTLHEIMSNGLKLYWEGYREAFHAKLKAAGSAKADQDVNSVLAHLS